jgi:hypothetical protein
MPESGSAGAYGASPVMPSLAKPMLVVVAWTAGTPGLRRVASGKGSNGHQRALVETLLATGSLSDYWSD